MSYCENVAPSRTKTTISAPNAEHLSIIFVHCMHCHGERKNISYMIRSVLFSPVIIIEEA